MGHLTLAFSVIFLLVLSVIPAFADSGTMTVVAGSAFQVNYNANGVKIQGMQTNPTYDELIVSVQVSSPNASLELTIPRALLDSKQGSNDIPFITVVDGTLENVLEKNPTSTTRTISMQLTPGNGQIEIIGTFVAVSGPTSGNIQTTPTPSNIPSQTTQPKQEANQSATHQPSTTQPPSTIPEILSQTKPETQANVTSENGTSHTNMTRNIIFQIPYVPNGVISLSYIDLSVIGAISIVVIIVIASVARRRPVKPSRTTR